MGTVIGPFTVTLALKTEPLSSALRSLEKLAEIRPELVKRFLHGRPGYSKLFRIDPDVRATGRADQYSVVLQPSDRLVDFLAAAGAGDV